MPEVERIRGGEAKGLVEGETFGRTRYIHTAEVAQTMEYQAHFLIKTRWPPGGSQKVTVILGIVARKHAYKNGYPFSF